MENIASRPHTGRFLKGHAFPTVDDGVNVVEDNV